MTRYPEHDIVPDEFIAGTVEALLFAGRTDDDDPLDWHAHDVDERTRDAIRRAANRFVSSLPDDARDVLLSDSALAGVLFWLTAAGHGAGYWDGKYADTDAGDIGDILTTAAHRAMPWAEDAYLDFIDGDGVAHIAAPGMGE